jgi:hypothetical protein
MEDLGLINNFFTSIFPAVTVKQWWHKTIDGVYLYCESVYEIRKKTGKKINYRSGFV